MNLFFRMGSEQNSNVKNFGYLNCSELCFVGMSEKD